MCRCIDALLLSPRLDQALLLLCSVLARSMIKAECEKKDMRMSEHCDQKIQNVIKTSQLNVQNIYVYIYIYVHIYIMFSVQTGCDVSQI